MEPALPSQAQRRAARSMPNQVLVEQLPAVALRCSIRWADLVYLKETWEDNQQRKKSAGKGKTIVQEPETGDDHVQGYRTLKVPVHDEIRQLVMSPNGTYLAIVTTHTVHIAFLPESSNLTAPDTGPIRPRTHMLGPTTHVTSRSAVSSVLWHPLGVKSRKMRWCDFGSSRPRTENLMTSQHLLLI